MSEPLTSVRWQLWIVAISFFMQSLDTTIVNTALPTIAHHLHENPLQMQSIVIAYVLTVAMLLPASGWLADKLGIRWVLIIAIFLFTLGSLFCGMAHTLNELIMFRIIQGVGGAIMVPVARLTVMRIVPRQQYMAAMTFVTLPGQIGPLVGPALGGLLVQYVSWHWIFLINIPVGIVGLIAIYYLMPNYKMQTHRFDSFGFVIMAVMMLSITLAVEGYKGLGLSTLTILSLYALCLLTLAIYYFYARHREKPLFHLDLFKIKTFKIGLIGSLVGRIGSGMLPFLTPIFLQIGLGFSPLVSGLMMVPLVLGSISMKQAIVPLVNRFGYRNVLVFATATLAIVAFIFPLIALQGWIVLLVIVLIFQGAANSVRFTTMNTLTLRDLPKELGSAGNGLLSMVMQLSMSLGVSFAGLFLGIFMPSHIVYGSPEVLMAFLCTYWGMAIVMAIPILAFLFAPKESGQNVNLTRKKV